LERVWAERRPILKAVIAAVIPNPSLVEDVLQEAFLRVIRSQKEFDDVSEAFRYLRTTALNTAIDFYRDQKRQYHRTIYSDPGTLPSPDCQSGTPLGLLLERQAESDWAVMSCKVRKAFESLPECERQALLLFYGPQRPTLLKDYCRDKGVNYSTLRGRMLRAVDRIRKHLHRHGVDGFRHKETSQ